MKLIKPYVEFIDLIDRNAILQKIERAGRTCYKSEENITPESASKFVANLVKRNHWAMIEHGASITVKFITDRGISHELVRHRLASFAQESTRYVKYGNASKDSEDIVFIMPSQFKGREGIYRRSDGNVTINNDPVEATWGDWAFIEACLDAEESYNILMERGWYAQEARAVLPNALKTEVVMTANLREWKHFLDLRSKGTTGAPHPDMKIVADMVYEKFHAELPEIFE